MSDIADILCIDASIFGTMRKGLITGPNAIRCLSAIGTSGLWMPRTPELESNEVLRQVIPYILVQNIDTGHVVRMVRKQKQQESRLHDRIYMGVGGHIERERGGSDKLVSIRQAAWRELGEELGIGRNEGSLFFQGLILASDLPVDRVHVGVFYHFLTARLDFTGEKDMHGESWSAIPQLARDYQNMETWARIVWDEYLSK